MSNKLNALLSACLTRITAKKSGYTLVSNNKTVAYTPFRKYVTVKTAVF